MTNEISDYERLCGLCDEELAAAEQAESKADRIEHLEHAFRFAQKASREKGGSLGADRKL